MVIYGEALREATISSTLSVRPASEDRTSLVIVVAASERYSAEGKSRIWLPFADIFDSELHT